MKRYAIECLNDQDKWVHGCYVEHGLKLALETRDMFNEYLKPKLHRVVEIVETRTVIEGEKE